MIRKDKIEVTVDDGAKREIKPGTCVRDLLEKKGNEAGLPYLGALVNNDMVSLSFPIEVDSKIQMLTLANSHGWRIYRNSAAFLLAKATYDIFPKALLSIEHSLGDGYFCNFEMNGSKGISKKQIKEIESRMHELVEADLPIVRRKIEYSDAIAHFEGQNRHDTVNLLRYSNPPKVVVNTCEEYMDLFHGPLADRTSALQHFKLFPYEDGFVIQFPDRDNKTPKMSPFERQPYLFDIFKSYKAWGRIVNVRTVGDLNTIIASGKLRDFIHISEAYQEKKIAEIADTITAHGGKIKWICIAGPSSSGKTTFAKRLCVQLRVNGLRPVAISVDDYFVDRTRTPMDENGEPDFENIETVDLKLLNEHLSLLDRGETVELPSFNFGAGTREFRGKTMKLESDQICVVEGIHSLNPRLTEAISPDHKYKIYISALTQLNLDYSNRVSTTDNRLIRRMIRDHNYRGNPALMTLKMWPSVRRGEKKWIFPYQAEANTAINSALDYELAILKPYVEPLLAEVKPYDPQYADARRLLEFLSRFNAAPSSLVPPTSLIREFIGESGFEY